MSEIAQVKSIATLEAKMGHIEAAIDNQSIELKKLAECYQENTVLLSQTCAVLQEFKAVKTEQNSAAIERVILQKDVALLKRWCKGLTLLSLIALGAASGAVDGDQIKTLVKLLGA